MVRSPLLAVGLLAGLAFGGCATPVTPALLARSGPSPEPSATPLEPSYPSHGLSRGENPSETLPDMMWQVVLADLQDLGEVDPAAQYALIEELKQAQPVHYPLVVQQFRTARMHREPEPVAAPRRLDQAADTLPSIAADGTPSRTERRRATELELSEPPARPLSAAGSQQMHRAPDMAERQPDYERAESAASEAFARNSALERLHQLTLAASPPPSWAGASRPEHTSAHRLPEYPPAQPLRTTGESSASRITLRDSTSWVSDTAGVSVAADAEQARPSLEAARRAFEQPRTAPHADDALRPSHFVSLASEASGAVPRATEAWRADLDRTIEGLGASLPDAPRTVDELHDHLRLRNLMLLADRHEEALEAIPGAGAGEQAFWSKQLFAMQAFLDTNAHADQRQRAAAALVHYEEARAQLAELATLRVRNAAFVDRVDGFGAYEPLAKNAFKPGQQVNVYAEVENYRSESTRDGYRTVLATSYLVVDEAGRRVDGGEFPEVEDVCLSRRRDFHMQYAIPLPDRIYPGPYALELVITDRLSNKIGSQRIAFEIAE